MVCVEEITECKKGKYKVFLDNGTVWPLYRGEIQIGRASCRERVYVSV